MAQYPHLKLPYTIAGATKPQRNFSNPSALTIENRYNRRQEHGNKLLRSIEMVERDWNDYIQNIRERGIVLPNENDIPILLKIDTEVFKIESLINWGIEVVSEEEDGYIIGASTDNLEQFKERVNAFLNEESKFKDKAAQLHDFVSTPEWRIDYILKDELKELWQDVQPDRIYHIEIGISINLVNKNQYPDIGRFNTNAEFEAALELFHNAERDFQILRDEKQIEREDEIESFVSVYGGEVLSIWENGNDAVYFKISLTGLGLKDFVITSQYLFEARFSAEFDIKNFNSDFDIAFSTEILPPTKDCSPVCVIDSGIQQGHRLIEPAIDKDNSKSYVDGDDSVADHVENSGHGTKVAGAILYPKEIPTNGSYQLETFIQNARILNSDNKISDQRFGPSLMNEIVHDFPDTRIFNLSVSETRGYMGSHMPALAASIDKLMYEKDVLFVVAAGNLFLSSPYVHNPGIKELIAEGKNYPDYLDEITSKIANPAISFFAISVGSVSNYDYEDDDYVALAGMYNVSPFSRCGLGLWDSIKPDVVEFGGDYVKHKINGNIINHKEVSLELINSTMFGAKAIGRDEVGTSFSTPKVSYIASRLNSLFPDESCIMYKALIVQSARHPNHCFLQPSFKDFCRYGYGIPDLNRAIDNLPTRITFIQDGNIAPRTADIFKVKIPDDIRGEGKSFKILMEVTLTFTADIRQTRKGAHSYLSSWCEWRSSRYNENFNSFRNRTINYLETEEQDEDVSGDAIKWCIRENSAWGSAKINRNNSTVQKSWTIIEPHQFANDFSIAIVGHVGWEKDLSKKNPYALCVSFEIMDSEMQIYDLIAEAQIETEIENNSVVESEIEL